MASEFSFPLLWTVGFSGKRHLPGLEQRVQQAIHETLQFLSKKAQQQQARLTSVSSVARGGDQIFAACCLGQEGTADFPPLPWKCLLPFPQKLFFDLDLASAPGPDGTTLPLGTAERQQRQAAAEACVNGCSSLEVLTAESEVTSDAARVTAYLECGYRTVDESDVMIVALRDAEFNHVVAKAKQRQAQSGHGGGSSLSKSTVALKAGTEAIALYAVASKRPSILLNVDAPDPWAARVILNEPDPAQGQSDWFHDPNVTDVMHHALSLPVKSIPQNQERAQTPPLSEHVPCTASRQSVWLLMQQLTAYAESSQKNTQWGLSSILTLHVVATAIAALGATVLGLTHAQFAEYSVALPGLVLVIIALAFTKPLLAGLALGIEHRQHKEHVRESWLYARILAELCHGAWATWPLPRQPMDAADEEDFPKVKRLLRTLRLMRILDPAAGVSAAPVADAALPVHERETQDEANMRAACGHYTEHRLRHQARYYAEKRTVSERQQRFWMRLFHCALIGTIVFGLILAVHKLQAYQHEKAPVAEVHANAAGGTAAEPHASEVHAHAPTPPWLDVYKYVEFAVIIGPFLASFALGMITVRDCRRRARRYDEMQRFIHRHADTLSDCTANNSRLRLIEQAERMLIEEQHEWFSTTRNFSV